ncbi:cation-transporting P-type ATPase [Jhaorihella thermophila]|uniref:cation-transporting P-type ATPase n=1 Tax=Jhaorihella thermophila TaxID=488547 RepID=UPI002E0F7F07
MSETRTDWHARTARQALAELGSSPSGLSQGEAAERLARHGPNALPQARQRGRCCGSCASSTTC